MIGRTLAHYRVLERLGSGGMGVVYAAQDTKLSRRVALKVLPAERADASSLSRFEREAKAVAALNHPNIVQVYSVEEVEGVHFITMELVRGKTLAELHPRSSLALERFFEIALPLTDALAQAHRAGIVHRDLKPANVMVSDEGRVKILDFGLAKAERSFAATALESDVCTLARTEDGEILGTVAYMSPEQAEGKPLDARSDIFSLGILLYEALSGRRPFGGDSPAAILSSILKDAPAPLREHRPEIPRDLIRIVHRCLEKDPDRRIQTATDVHNELEEVKRDLDSGELPNDIQVSSRSSSRKRTFLWASAGLLVLLASVALLFRPSRNVDLPRLTRPIQVTSAGGVETRPTWSPDGGRIAFESDQGENADIWVAQIGSGVPVNLTADSSRNDRYPRWSPDGSQIAFASGRDTFVVPAVGGTARKVHSAEDLVLSRGSSWSPDGTRLAVSFWVAGGVAIDLVSMETLQTERIPGTHYCEEMSWTPDGETFACVDAGQPNWAVSRPFLFTPGKDPVILLDDGSKSLNPTWSSDGRRLFFISNRGGSMDLWQQRLGADGEPEGPPEQLTTGVGMRSAAFSLDGKKLAYSQGRTVANVWRVPILEDRAATWTDAQQLTFDRAYIRYLDVTPDGESLLVDSDRDGRHHLWILPSSGGALTQLTAGPAPDLHPKLSPDGKEIVFYSWRSGDRDIYIMPAGGGTARLLSPSPGHDIQPSWSPDGEEIAFTSNRGGNNDIWVVSSRGGEARQLTDTDALDQGSQWSPDGELLTFESWREGSLQVWAVPAGGGDAEKLTDRGGRAMAWSPDGTTLYTVAFGVPVLARSMESGTESVVTDLSGRAGVFGESIDTDGEYLYFTWVEESGDIWVMDVDTGASD